MSAPTVNFLMVLKNASILKKEVVQFQFSSFSLKLLGSLYLEGFVQTYAPAVTASIYFFLGIQVRQGVKYSLMSGLKFLSKPSISRYARFKDICFFSERRSFILISTDRGLLSTLECKQQKSGGKLLFACS